MNSKPFHSVLRVLTRDPGPAYRAAQLDSDHARGLIVMAYVGLVYPTFYGLDLLMYPGQALPFGVVRGNASVMSGLAYAVTRLPRFRAATRPLAMLLALAYTSGISFMCGRTDGFDSIYVVGVMLCFLAVTTIEIFRPMQLLVALTGSSVMHMVIVGFMTGVWSSPGMVAAAAFLMGTVLFSTIGALLLEGQRQRLFAVHSALEQRHEELERALGHQARFLSTVSHELRSPINSVLGFTALVREREEQLHPKSDRNLKMVEDSAKRLLRFVNDLLDLSKIEAGRLELALDDFDLSETVREVGEVTQPLLGRREVALSIEVPDHCAVRSDETRIRQILINLASNAARFTEAGRIDIRLEPLTDGAVVLSVADTGVGIPEDARETIFEAFRQAHLHTNSGGTGLGLSIVSSLVEALDGQIELNSEVGVGSTFRITLPGIARQEAA